MEALNAGFLEIEHTADTAIRVWAPEYSSLFEEAAKGMNYIAGIDLENRNRKFHSFILEAQELESLLVMFLEEILFLGESEGVGFDQYNIEIKDRFTLKAKLKGSKIMNKKKELKAVTFHNLDIIKVGLNYEGVVVFDV